MSMIVIMPGGFHPFHAGHFALYQSAKKAFPNADLYVAATNDQSERPFPFALKEKLAKLAGVEPGHFVQVKSPFQCKEITQNYDPNRDVLVFVRSEKDKTEQPKPGGTKKDGTPAYFQPWTGKNLQPFGKHAYIAYLPTVEFGPGITSASEIRALWPTLNDSRKLRLVNSLYPATTKKPELAQKVIHMFDQVMIGQNVTESINNDKPLEWCDLDEGLSMENKMAIFEEYHTYGSLTEENSEDNINYFNSLSEYNTIPVKNHKYIVAPISLINNKLMPLDSPKIMKFLGKNHDGMVFNIGKENKTYPSPGLRKLSLYQVFTFDNKSTYDKFKTAVALKFDISLPDVGLQEGVAEGSVAPLNDNPATIKRLAKQWWTGNQQQYAQAQQMLNKMGWDIYEDEDDIILSKDGQEIVFSMDELQGVVESSLNEFAPGHGGGGNYFRELASAWYNGTFNSKSLQKGIKSQQDVERLLQRGIICPDGKTRKYGIDYNADFDGVVISSNDYYEHSDYNDKGQEVDSRTGKLWGPYDYMEFSGDELDESIDQDVAEGEVIKGLFNPQQRQAAKAEQDRQKQLIQTKKDWDEYQKHQIAFEDKLKRLAAWWYNNDENPVLEKKLAAMGLEIGRDEGYDNGGVFIVASGDENGDSYLSWPAEELEQLSESLKLNLSRKSKTPRQESKDAQNQDYIDEK